PSPPILWRPHERACQVLHSTARKAVGEMAGLLRLLVGSLLHLALPHLPLRPGEGATRPGRAGQRRHPAARGIGWPRLSPGLDPARQLPRAPRARPRGAEGRGGHPPLPAHGPPLAARPAHGKTRPLVRRPSLGWLLAWKGRKE